MTAKMLIANRGEIAVRIIHACRELGIGSVAVFSDADAGAMHVRLADEAVRIGRAPAVESYLDTGAILAAAATSGAGLVHPGYGFLSEHADFAESCRAAGLVFVGPSAAALRRMGDKGAARALARASGVPIVEGYDGADQSDARLAGEARRIGYPVLIKAAMGGGGMAMHAVDRASRLRSVLAQARREAGAAFGDERLILERLLSRPRHVEIQVLGDAHGTLIALGERDCSTQRRRQKVIEETPSPGVDAAARERLCALALKVARAAGYTNAGTVEFLLDADGSVYFLEMNTRLQVEHAVTEAVYAVDLVRLQIEIALGGRIDPLLAAVPRGHALECRLYAEDPARGFLPSTGRVLRLRLPEGAGIRNDVGVAEGDEIGPYYDLMLGKLTVWAPDRAAAIRRMDRALADLVLFGVTTNLNLLRQIVASDAFGRGDIDVSYLERELPSLLEGTQPPAAAFAAALAEQLLRGQSGADGADLWRRLGPWRIGGWETACVLECDGSRREVRAARQSSDGTWRLASGADAWTVQADNEPGDGLSLGHDGEHERWELISRDGDIWVKSRDGVWLLHLSDAAAERRTHRPDAAGHSGDIDAPMPGLVRKVQGRPGQRVRAHQVLVVLEAMKMEHAIEAPADGVISAVYCHEGQLVQAGARLIDLQG